MSLSKGKLFCIISAATIAILFVPIIIPHFSHSMFPHLLLHLTALIMAVFLVSIAVISYRRVHSRRLLLTALAFIALASIEALYMLNAGLMGNGYLIPATDIEVAHILGLAMLALFSLGILKVN